VYQGISILLTVIGIAVSILILVHAAVRVEHHWRPYAHTGLRIVAGASDCQSRVANECLDWLLRQVLRAITAVGAQLAACATALHKLRPLLD
jgi:hypothetical protein